MWLFEIIFFTIYFALIEYFWKLIQFYLKIFKIPKSSFNSSFRKAWKFVNGDTKFCFKEICSSLKTERLTRSWFGPFAVINIVTPEDSRIIFNSKNCLDKPNFLKKCLKLEQGTLFGNIQVWRSHRKILSPYFGNKHIRSIVPIFKMKVKILMENLVKMDGKKEFDIFYFMAESTLDNILTLMELDLDTENETKKNRDTFSKDIECYSEIAILRTIKFWFYSDFLFKQSNLGKKQNLAKLNIEKNLVYRVVKNIRENKQNDNIPENFIRALMDSKNNFTEKEICDEVFTLISAAQGTSAIASSTVLLMLAMHKNVQYKVLNELKQIIGNGTEHLDFEKLSKLNYLDMVINESLRLFPIVPLIFKRNYEDIKSNEDYIIPAGSNIVISIYSIHRSKTVWGEDAEKFRPERFEKENFEKIHPYAFIPFSKGPRMCLGYRYAMLLLKIQLANILMTYEIDTSLKFEELEFKLNITSNVCQGYMITLRKIKKQVK